MYRNLTLNECDKYSDIYTINRIDPEIKIKTKKPISSTYDNFTIVSDQFKAFCEQEGYEGLEFVTLPKSPGLYWLKIHNVIELDKKGRRIGAIGIEFINYNEQCKGYEEVIGASPVFLKIKELIPDGFFRTDLCFGSFANKFPPILIGIETMKKIKSAGFKGIDASEIKDKYD
ncbi:hypothetical protein [Mucilaginibacter psychrotolerans]|uniref:Uncharacterized protein n=1 Tax=Mucilaginibacter psychrotolerans TaxID=1524096 RepID=A0A4Y8S5E4_9SPHI|nr:hypothetical protein [Mucilaginibacter psychrotolerans]TFF33956.1 hypothetical protein E2R66_23535 [Mucilaginibacter psychrotolerans]